MGQLCCCTGALVAPHVSPAVPSSLVSLRDVLGPGRAHSPSQVQRSLSAPRSLHGHSEGLQGPRHLQGQELTPRSPQELLDPCTGTSPLGCCPSPAEQARAVGQDWAHTQGSGDVGQGDMQPRAVRRGSERNGEADCSGSQVTLVPMEG